MDINIKLKFVYVNLVWICTAMILLACDSDHDSHSSDHTHNSSHSHHEKVSERAIVISELLGTSDQGESTFQTHCASCHGTHAQGGIGPDLPSHFATHSVVNLIDVILDGTENMPAFAQLEDQVIADLIAYIQRL